VVEVRVVDGPHWVVVRGLVLPRPVGGHPALDFVNTLAGWGEPVRSDFLASYDHVAVVAEQAGLLDPQSVAALRRRAATRPRDAEEVVVRARELRARLRAVIRDPVDRRAMSALSRLVQPALAQLHLMPGARPTWEVGGGLDRPLSAIAWSGAQIVTGTDLATVHACPGHECGWLFLDPRGRRRWCSMRSCGNRAKVAAFRERQRES
jgi:predicted RNA-binding Zn ribbon-like protein